MFNLTHKRHVKLNYKDISISPIRLAKELKHQIGKTTDNKVCCQSVGKQIYKGQLSKIYHKFIYPLTQQFPMLAMRPRKILTCVIICMHNVFKQH